MRGTADAIIYVMVLSQDVRRRSQAGLKLFVVSALICHALLLNILPDQSAHVSYELICQTPGRASVNEQ